MPLSENHKPPSKLPMDPGTSDILDVADGVDRIMGNQALYVRMLIRFRQDYMHAAGPVQAALAAGDTALAQRLAHTLKGAAGLIGARQLHQTSSELEAAIRNETGLQQSALVQLGLAFAATLDRIDAVLDDRPAPGADSTPRPLMKDPALLARLVELLTSGDGAAVDLLEESGASLKVVLGEARLAQVAAAVNAFDFEGALRALKQTGGN